jgi:ketosteroid isomerase-like protein
MANFENLSLAQSFLAAANQYDVEKVLGMFHDNAEFELVGLYRLEGKNQIRNVFEYDAGVHTKLELLDIQVEEDTVKGKLVERNDRLDAIGFNKLDYPFCSLTFRNGRIQKFSAKADDEAIKKIGEMWKGFLPWITREYPSDRAILFTSEGKFIYNRENGKRVVTLLNEWRKGG